MTWGCQLFLTDTLRIPALFWNIQPARGTILLGSRMLRKILLGKLLKITHKITFQEGLKYFLMPSKTWYILDKNLRASLELTVLKVLWCMPRHCHVQWSRKKPSSSTALHSSLPRMSFTFRRSFYLFHHELPHLLGKNSSKSSQSTEQVLSISSSAWVPTRGRLVDTT